MTFFTPVIHQSSLFKISYFESLKQWPFPVNSELNTLRRCRLFHHPPAHLPTPRPHPTSDVTVAATATMSNSHPLRPLASVSEIDHIHLLSEQLGQLVLGEEYSDVTFVVEGKRFPAHRVILAARCHYFRYEKDIRLFKLVMVCQR